MSIPTDLEISKVTYNKVEIPLPSGGASGEYVVRVIDYDGTILKEENLDTGATFTLPSQPSHSNLIFQEWSSPVDIVDNKVTVVDSDIIIGAVYTTASGLSEFDITLTKVTGLDVTLNMNGTKNWGDGTSDDLTTHTYADYGDYTITCNGTTMTTSSSVGLFNQGYESPNYYCTKIRLANINTIVGEAFRRCRSLKTIIIPNSVTSLGTHGIADCYSLTNVIMPSSLKSIGDNAFSYCYSLINMIIPKGLTSIISNFVNNCRSLTNVIIPAGVTSIADFAFTSCHSLTKITIPNSVVSMGMSEFYRCYSLSGVIIPSSLMSISQSAFSECSSLTSVAIPKSVTSIISNTFKSCYSMLEYDFSEYDTPPALSSTTAFSDINGACKILVKDANALAAFQTATNWSTYADYMYIKE